MEARERRFALTLSAAHGIDHFLRRVFPPLLPLWAAAYGFPLWQLGVLLGAQSLGTAVVQTPMGHLADRYDRRLLLPAGIAVIGGSTLVFVAAATAGPLPFGLTVAGTALSGQFVAMTLAQVGIGLGSSSLHPTGYPLLSQNVAAERKGTALGLWGSARALGDGGAPALVGVALLVTGWPSILLGIGVVGLAYAGYLYVALGGYDTRPAGTDDDAPAEPLSALDRRRYLYPFLAIFASFALQMASITSALIFLPEYITSRFGFAFDVLGVAVTPASTASFYYSALLLTAAGVQLGTGRLVDRYDHRQVLIAYLVAGAAVLVVLTAVPLGPVGLFVVLLLLGATLWGMNPARDAILSAISPPEREGRTFGYFWTGGLLIASAAPPVAGYVGDVAGLGTTFLLIAALVFLSAVPIAALLSERVWVGAGTVEASAGD